MSSVERIHEAEAQVQQVQDVLGLVQSGLTRAEHVAETAEKARGRAGRILLVGGIVVGVLVIVAVIRRRREDEPAED